MRHVVIALGIGLWVGSLGFVACDRAPARSTPPAGEAQTNKRLRFIDGINMDVRDVPLLMALDDLAANGYQIEKTFIDGNTLLAAVLARGDADIGVVNSQSTWAAVASGGDVRTVSEFARYTALLIASGDIRSCRDLDGRKVAIPGTSGFAGLMFKLYIRKCGVEPEVLVMGEAAARTSALLAHRIDAAMSPGEEMIKLNEQSATPFHSVGAFAEEFPGFVIDGLQVNRAWAERHRDTVVDLLTAQLRAQRLARSKPELLYAEAVKRLGISSTSAKAIADAHLQMDIWDANGGLTLERVQSTIDLLSDAKAVPAGLTAAGVAELSYLDAARARLNSTSSTR